MRSKLDITNFTDYRVFLRVYADSMKKKNPRWSLGAWAKALDLKTTSSITKILNAERDAGTAITERLINYFKFDEAQAQYFRDLVKLQKMKKDPAIANILLEKMSSLKSEETSRALAEEDYLFLSNWYYLVLCEMCRNKAFKKDYKWISSKLIPEVDPKEVRKAINLLQKEELIKTNEDGSLAPSYERLYAISKKHARIIRLFYSQLIDISQNALLGMPPEERHFSTLMVHLSSKSLERANQLIADFRTKFEKLMYEKDGDQVYLLQLQMFPVTKKLD